MARKKRILDLPKNKRPRERLVYYGSQNLSEIELLATLLGTGSRKQDVLTLAKSLLRLYPLHKLKTVKLSELLSIPGVGLTKATRIAAALELGNRIFATTLHKTVITTTEDALKEFRGIAEKRQEFLVVLYLNARHELLRKEVVAQGGLNINAVEPRDILAPALTTPCSSIIIAHNHPSGNPTPSRADIQFTVNLKKAGEIMGIEMKEHLIVCTSDYFSFSASSPSFRQS